MQLDQIYDFLADRAPVELAESWDNVGILIRCQEKIEKVLLTMDVTSQVVEEAIREDCQLIISHHPVIFRGLKALDAGSFIGKAMQNNISVISMHTNLDKAAGGVNDVLAQEIGLQDIEVYEEMGRMGNLPDQMTMKDFADMVAKKLDTTVKYTMPDKTVRKVALIGGSAGEYWAGAKAVGVDVFLTGEASHHHCIDAREAGVAILVGGHWNTERPVLYDLERRLKDRFADLKIQVSEMDQDPFSYVSCQRPVL